MVAAALKVAPDDQSPVTYKSAEDARMDIFSTLNYFEALEEYQWPDDNHPDYPFDQIMRLRRQFVSNVFMALKRAGTVKVVSDDKTAVQLNGDVESVKKKRESAGKLGGSARKTQLMIDIVSGRLAKRKRLCKVEDESETVVKQVKGVIAGKSSVYGSMPCLFRPLLTHFSPVNSLVARWENHLLPRTKVVPISNRYDAC
jgi:hypothetical protein